MQKDFDSWNIHKKKTHLIQKRPLFSEREVWWCSLGANIGDEQDGKGEFFTRPVLVIKKFNWNIFLGTPLSTQIKDKPYYHTFHFNGINQSVILSQLRLIDAKRLHDRMGRLPSDEFQKVQEKLKQLIF